MKRTQAFPGKFLAQDDVAEKPLVAKIDKAIREEVGDGENTETKTTLHFLDGIKPIVLNGVNWDTIESMYGDDSDLWHGKEIEIYRDPTVRYGNKVTGGIRVRKPGNGNSEYTIEALKDLRQRLVAAGGEKPKLLDTDIDTADKLKAQIEAHKKLLTAKLAETI